MKTKDLKEILEETEKAFGGCKKCYGKGYFTVLEHISGRGETDFGNGDTTIFEELPRMRFCTCERGKGLKKEIENIRQADLADVRAFVEGKIGEYAIEKSRTMENSPYRYACEGSIASLEDFLTYLTSNKEKI